MRDARERGFSIAGRLSAVVICVAAFQTAATARAGLAAFQYGEVTEPITSATFSVDLAAMNAHRTVGGFEVNFVQLVDVSSGLPDYDLSDELFGVASPLAPPLIDMGPVETGVVSGVIAPSFFPALAGGSLGLRALFTDTVDAMFAMDFISLIVETATTTIVSYYGWPVGNENDGFGLGIPDGGNLPSPLPDSLPPGSTGTGFDETISSKSILAIPEPGVVWMLCLGGLAAVRRWGNTRRCP